MSTSNFYPSLKYKKLQLLINDVLIEKNKNSDNLKMQYLESINNKHVDYFQFVVERVKLIM